MSNYNFVRANFCVPKPTSSESLYNLFKELDSQGCSYNQVGIGSITGYLLSTDTAINVVETNVSEGFGDAQMWQVSQWMSVPGYLTIDLHWQLDTALYASRIMQIYHPESQVARIVFDLEDRFFFNDGEIELHDWEQPEVKRYEKLLVSIIRSIRPDLATIDYEADLDCTQMQPLSSLVSWGIYLSNSVVGNGGSDFLAKLTENVDRNILVDELGSLVFLYPLRVNQAWTERHKDIERLLDEYQLT